MDLDAGQQAIVEHRAGPLRVVGGFGSGKTAALQARADRLRSEGRRPLVLHHCDLEGFAFGLLHRHGERVRGIDDDERLALVGRLVDHDVEEAASAVLAFQASFLGDEELRVHADAAGCLDEAEELIGLTDRYLAALAERGQVDPAGVFVRASTRLRDPDVRAGERAAFDELLVDDFQLASFASHRLVTQLVGPEGPIVVAGNAAAAVSSDPLSSPSFLDRFDRRFGATSIGLDDRHRRSGIPALRIVEDEAGEAVAIDELVSTAAARGLPAAILNRGRAEDAVGREWPFVVVHGATDGRWPAPRPRPRWFDVAVLHGPDVAGEDERDREWHEAERRRFAVAASRSTAWLVVVAEPPVSPFVADLVD